MRMILCLSSGRPDRKVPGGWTVAEAGPVDLDRFQTADSFQHAPPPPQGEPDQATRPEWVGRGTIDAVPDPDQKLPSRVPSVTTAASASSGATTATMKMSA